MGCVGFLWAVAIVCIALQETLTLPDGMRMPQRGLHPARNLVLAGLGFELIRVSATSVISILQ